MDKEQIKQQIESGEVSIDTLIDSFLLERQRAGSLYAIIDRLEKIVERLEQDLNKAQVLRVSSFQETDRIVSFLEKVTPNFRNSWGSILDYIEEYLRAHNGEARYIEISEISIVPSPVDLDEFVKRWQKDDNS